MTLIEKLEMLEEAGFTYAQAKAILKVIEMAFRPRHF